MAKAHGGRAELGSGGDGVSADPKTDGLRQIAEDIYATHLAPLHAQIAALTAQRDALNTALEAILDHAGSMYVPTDAARAALALVKGDA